MHGSKTTGAWRRCLRLPTTLPAWLAAIALCGPISAVVIAQEAGPRTTYVKDREFQIPIQIRADKLETLQELRLWMSSDGGRNWRMVRKAEPTRKHFRMVAQTDGEYLFTLAYVDKEGNVEPSDVQSRPPGMKVVVDTNKPMMTLRALPPQKGNVGVAWTIQDQKPNLDKLRVQVRRQQDADWTDVRIDQKVVEGQVEWPVDAGDNYVAQVSVEDRAGNQTSKTIDVPGVPGTNEAPPTPRGPIANRESRPPAAPFGAEPLPAPPRARAAVAEEDAAPAIPSAPKRIRRSAPAQVADVPSRPAVSRAALVAAPPKADLPIFDPTQVDMPPDQPASGEAAAAVAPPTNRIVKKSASRDDALTLASSVEPEEEKAPTPPPPEEPKIKLINSPRFQLSYDVAGAGPAGVGKVELYMTRNGGKTWELCCNDPDLESPMDVTLPGEGKYGLSVVVTNKAGVGQRPPKAGDQPQMLMHVDMKSPIVKWLPPAPDPINPRDVLMLNWETNDEHPADKAVDLYFSHDPEIGWYKIARGLPPTGSYGWRVPQRISHQVHFRMICRDQCGNEGRYQTGRPVTVDLSNPQGKIAGIVNVLPAEKTDE